MLASGEPTAESTPRPDDPWTYTLTIPNDPRAVTICRRTLRLILTVRWGSAVWIELNHPQFSAALFTTLRRRLSAACSFRQMMQMTFRSGRTR